MTFMTINEIFSSEIFQTIRISLFNKCEALESQKKPLEDLVKEMHKFCSDLVLEKISGTELTAKYRRACSLGEYSGLAYIEGKAHGKMECQNTGTPASRLRYQVPPIAQ